MILRGRVALPFLNPSEANSSLEVAGGLRGLGRAWMSDQVIWMLRNLSTPLPILGEGLPQVLCSGLWVLWSLAEVHGDESLVKGEEIARPPSTAAWSGFTTL